MGRAEPPVCAEPRVEMPPVAIAARPVAHVAANARRVNPAGDGCTMTDGIALAAKPLRKVTPLLPAAATEGSDRGAPLCGRVEHRLQIETLPRRGQANREPRCRCRNTSSPTITRLTTLAPTPAANAGS